MSSCTLARRFLVGSLFLLLPLHAAPVHAYARLHHELTQGPDGFVPDEAVPLPFHQLQEKLRHCGIVKVREGGGKLEPKPLWDGGILQCRPERLEPILQKESSAFFVSSVTFLSS